MSSDRVCHTVSTDVCSALHAPETPIRARWLMAGAYWPRPWTCEDGGPAAALLRRRRAGPRDPARRAARGHGRPSTPSRPTCSCGANPGELYALRHDMPARRPRRDPGRGLGRAARPRDTRGDRIHPAAAGRHLLARRDRRARERRPPHGLRPLGAPPQPRPRGAGLPPAAGRRARTTRSWCSTAASS